LRGIVHDRRWRIAATAMMPWSGGDTGDAPLDPTT
jgi:hypothetical protein